jgi:hypothetical protein
VVLATAEAAMADLGQYKDWRPAMKTVLGFSGGTPRPHGGKPSAVDGMTIAQVWINTPRQQTRPVVEVLSVAGGL